MKVLFDTSVLVAACVEQHEFHQRAYPWLEKVFKLETAACICQHSLAELYAVLTTLPIQPRIFPEMASRLINENLKLIELVPLTPKDYQWCINRLSDLGQPGGVIYDALAARAALKAHVNHLVTFDPDDFRRVLPTEDQNIILVPS